MRWVISGRVQGVGFRWFTVRLAEKLGVSGWVTNLPDGRVEVVARGTQESLVRLEEGLRSGPGTGHVESVEKSDVPRESIEPMSFKVI
ncbi:MAG: acylphosphatase [Gemmatimonadetes bacterium]|nr:acylphosphatase [Gemmatimonadota bacterium]